ncbi:Lrp/AsnC family transcriptional regulator [Streptomyces sp. NPDC055092]
MAAKQRTRGQTGGGHQARFPAHHAPHLATGGAGQPGQTHLISGYRTVIDPVALGRGLEVLVDVEVSATDRKTFEEFEEFEETVSSYEEVIEFRRLFGRPDYFLRVAVADHAAYEAFLTGKLSGLPCVLRLESHLTMKNVKTKR